MAKKKSTKKSSKKSVKKKAQAKSVFVIVVQREVGDPVVYGTFTSMDKAVNYFNPGDLELGDTATFAEVLSVRC